MEARGRAAVLKQHGTQPTDTEVRGSTISTAISIASKNYITIRDLELHGFAEYGIRATGTCNNLIFDNNTIYGIEDYGIHLVNEVSSSTISNNTITNINSAGILSGETGGDNCVIQDNVISNVGIYKNLGLHGFAFWRGHSNAIMSGGANTIIQYNRIINCGYAGIKFVGYDNRIRYNYIEKTAQLIGDGGAIYTWSSDIAIPLSPGTIISYNILNGNGGVASMYMDDRTQGVLIEKNTIINTVKVAAFTGGSYAVFIKGKDNTFKNNVLFNNSRGITVASIYTGLVLDSNIVYNTALTTNSGGLTPLLAQASSTGFSDTYFNHNTYIDRTRTTTFRITSTNINLADWKTGLSTDAASTFTGTALNANETENIFYNDTKIAKTFYLNGATSVKDAVTGATITVSFTLQPFTSKIITGVNLNLIE